MIKICVGKKLNDISKAIIKEIDKDYPDNIVVVPDRFSLLCEKMIFDELNIKSTFNIKVMGITKLAREIIEKANLDCIYADSLECKLLLLRAIQNVKDNFLCFSKNISIGLVQKIQNVLSLVRASNITSENLFDFSKDAKTNLQAKMHDLALVDSEYEKLLGGKLDGTNTLKLFGTIIDGSLQVKNTNFYFCGFDAFTKQGYEIVKSISKNCHEFVIGAFDCAVKEKNAGIFDGELFCNLKNIFEDNKCEYEVKKVNFVHSIAQNQIENNVFGYDVKEDKFLDYAQVIETSNKTEEIELVAKKICELVKTKKCKFKDIAICASSEYFDEIDSIFSNADICFYNDTSKDMSSTAFYQFVRYLFDLKISNFDSESLLNLLFCPFVELKKEQKCQIANYIKEQNIEYNKKDKLFMQFEDNEFFETIRIFDKVENKNTVKYFVEVIENCLEKLKICEKIDNFCQIFKKNGDFLNEKIYLQIFEKFENVNAKLKSVLCEEEISIENFVELYFDTLCDIKISTVPLSCDSVFVGDPTQSYFEEVKYMFVLGANQDMMPSVNKDMGLVCDDEIQKLEKLLPISPTVKTINKRNKFKVFDLLSFATEKLFVLYHLVSSDGSTLLPSQFALDILTLNENKNLVLTTEVEDKFVSNDITKSMFNSPNILFAKQQLSPFNKNSALIKKALNNLKCDLSFSSLCENKIENSNIMLKNDKTKVSQIESYYSCPFVHFVRYGLKLKEQKTIDFQAQDFGNFIHKFAELFFKQTKQNLLLLSDDDVKKIAEQIFDEIASYLEYKTLLEDENKELKFILKNEVVRFALFMAKEQQNSDFRFNKAEYRFGDNNAFCLRVDNKDYSLVGVVDRFDTYENNVRIVDYKTGKGQVNSSGLKNLFYGTKIQVYVYLKALSDKFNYNPFGAFYLPVNNSFDDEGEKEYKMLGYFLDNKELVLHCDKTLGFDNTKSKFIEAGISDSQKNKKSGTIEIKSKKKVSSENMQNMLNYAVKMVENAIKDIINGNITPSPFEGMCEKCKYSLICAKEIKNVTERKSEFDLKNFSFDFGGQDE